jgi:hypothetical protein
MLVFRVIYFFLYIYRYGAFHLIYNNIKRNYFAFIVMNWQFFGIDRIEYFALELPGFGLRGVNLRTINLPPACASSRLSHSTGGRRVR